MANLNRITGKLLFLTTVLLQVKAQLFTNAVHEYTDFPWENIITGDDEYFTNTQYYQIFYNWMEGTQWSKLEYATQCRSAMSSH